MVSPTVDSFEKDSTHTSSATDGIHGWEWRCLRSGGRSRGRGRGGRLPVHLGITVDGNLIVGAVKRCALLGRVRVHEPLECRRSDMPYALSAPTDEVPWNDREFCFVERLRAQEPDHAEWLSQEHRPAADFASLDRAVSHCVRQPCTSWCRGRYFRTRMLHFRMDRQLHVIFPLTRHEHLWRPWL